MQSSDLTAILARLQSQQDLSREQMRVAIGEFLTGEVPTEAMRSFLVLLSQKGETVDELVGAALALRQSMITIRTSRRPLVDTCGTGGDGSKTFNISTAAALVIAAAGTPVAKHGNRKITSSSGSADVLAELGISLEATPSIVQKCLEEIGICFCFAPYFHPAMKHVGPVRREIGRPTIFNRLGPLANPAACDRQILGVGDPGSQQLMAAALQQLGTSRSLVVHGHDGVDEISLSAPTRVMEVTPQGIAEHTWRPEDFGVEMADRKHLFADDPAASAACIRSVLAGDCGPMRDVVVINAAAGLWVADRDSDLRACAQLVEEALDSGAAAGVVTALAQATSAS